MFNLTNILAREGYFGKKSNSQGIIKWHYDSSYIYYNCDRSKNVDCIRVKKNLPCGECKGTTNVQYALIQ